MQKIAVIQISEAGKDIAQILQRELGAKIITRTEVGKQWQKYDAFVFIGAMGICVRTIAPYIKDKHEDPAVVCVDSLGQNAISVLSGHIGGANDLAREVAAAIGAREVITTQSDNAGLWALDTFAERFNWAIASDDDMNACIYAFVNREPTALLMEICDEGTNYLEKTLPEHVTVVKSLEEVDPTKFKLVILVTPYNLCAPYGVLELHFVPMIAALGFGLAHHPDDYEDIYDEIDEAMSQIGVLPCYKRYCTIDVKQDEEFCAMLVDDLGEELVFYTAEELAKVEVPNPSETVQKHVGTPSVCEAAAILGSNHGKLIVPKVKGKNWTAALAIDYRYLREKQGHIEIVGAGPGDPDTWQVVTGLTTSNISLSGYVGSSIPAVSVNADGTVAINYAGQELYTRTDGTSAVTGFEWINSVISPTYNGNANSIDLKDLRIIKFDKLVAVYKDNNHYYAVEQLHNGDGTVTFVNTRIGVVSYEIDLDLCMGGWENTASAEEMNFKIRIKGKVNGSPLKYSGTNTEVSIERKINIQDGQHKYYLTDLPKYDGEGKIIDWEIEEIKFAGKTIGLNSVGEKSFTIDGKNCVVSAGAIKLIDFHHRNREPIGKRMIYQLPWNGNVMKHKWTEKLYKITKL